jgi:peptidoglycan DL-endopeptidase CwlO
VALCVTTTAAGRPAALRPHAAASSAAHSSQAAHSPVQARSAQFAATGEARAGAARAGAAYRAAADAGPAHRHGSPAAKARAWSVRIMTALAAGARAGAGGTGVTQAGITQTGLQGPGRSRSAERHVSVAKQKASATAPAVAPLKKLRQADLLVVAPAALPPAATARIRRLPGVLAAQPVDAARIEVNGSFVTMLGVDPSAFRGFAARPTARSTGLWQNVADGGIAVSYTMGKQKKIPLGGSVKVAGARTERLRVGGFGTVGISGVDAVVSDSVARSLGLPVGNAIVISAPHARLTALMAKIKKLLPAHAAIAPLVAQAPSSGVPVSTGAAGSTSITAADGPGLSSAQVTRFLMAATSRLGLPYVWGATGPLSFDCSGLVQWSLAQAGVTMPRVAVDQARTGPQVPVSDLRPGDLLFYFTDPTAPTYISHVAIYLGGGRMIQAPAPGMNVEVVPAIVGGSGFAGAVRVYPGTAAAVAANLAG